MCFDGAQIVLSVAEHHSNIVPWQLVAQRTGAVLRFVGLTSEDTLDLEQLKGFLNERTKLVSTFHVSNVLGMYLEFNGTCTTVILDRISSYNTF